MDAGKCAKITDMFATGAAVTSTSVVVPDVVQAQALKGVKERHGHRQVEEEAGDSEAEGQSHRDKASEQEKSGGEAVSVK